MPPNDPFDEGQMSTQHQPREEPMTMLKYREVKNPSFSANEAECELQDAMLTPFRLSFDVLDEAVDRLERDGVYSAEVAEAARDEIETLIREMHYLVISKVELHDRLRADERASS
jgi:hypothetical protein